MAGYRYDLMPLVNEFIRRSLLVLVGHRAPETEWEIVALVVTHTGLVSLQVPVVGLTKQ